MAVERRARSTRRKRRQNVWMRQERIELRSGRLAAQKSIYICYCCFLCWKTHEDSQATTECKRKKRPRRDAHVFVHTRGICDLMWSNAFECRIPSFQALISRSFLAACLDFVIRIDLSRRIHQPKHIVLHEVVPTVRH